MARIRLGVLDQSPIPEGGNGAQALRNSVDLARHVEGLGYGRYWVAEHHGTPMLACSSPEILISEIANATSRIRVGSGGVMLSHYSPYKVAEVFSVLGGIHGKRIDLGVGKAPGGTLEATVALQRDRAHLLPDDFEEQLAELIAHLDGSVPADHPFAKLDRLPGSPGTAELWLLGTSPQSANLAAALGLPFAVADFINPGSSVSGPHYREHFRPTPGRKSPAVIVAVGVVCAVTDDEAEMLSSSWRMAITLAERGQFGSLPTVTRAVEFVAGETGDTFAGRRVVVGSPDTVRVALEEIAAEYGADEILIHTMTHNHAARRRSYELVAEAFGLASARAGGRRAVAKRR